MLNLITFPGFVNDIIAQNRVYILVEFDFRYNHRKINDWERTSKALKGIEGKRLTYRRPRKAA